MCACGLPTMAGTAGGKISLGEIASRVLDTPLSSSAVPILARKKSHERKLDEAKKEEREALAVTRAKKLMATQAHLTTRVKRGIDADVSGANDPVLETTLRKIATKGVVALFNQVRSAQRNLPEKETKKKKRERPEAIPEGNAPPLDLSKDSFLDILRRGSGKPAGGTAGTPGASFLRDDFMLGKSKAKDWERSVGEEHEEEEEEDDEEGEVSSSPVAAPLGEKNDERKAATDAGCLGPLSSSLGGEIGASAALPPFSFEQVSSATAPLPGRFVNKLDTKKPGRVTAGMGGTADDDFSETGLARFSSPSRSLLPFCSSSFCCCCCLYCCNNSSSSAISFLRRRARSKSSSKAAFFFSFIKRMILDSHASTVFLAGGGACI